jgi:hypothetical protein
MNAGPEGRMVFDYQRQIQPIWDKHCIKCHDGKKKTVNLTGALTAQFNRSYDDLVKRKLITNNSPYWNEEGVRGAPQLAPPYSLGAHGAVLAAVVMKDAPKHPFKGKDKQRVTTLRAAHKKVVLTEEEKVTIALWLDAKAPFYPSYFGIKNAFYKDSAFFRPAVSFEEAIAPIYPARMKALYLNPPKKQVSKPKRKPKPKKAKPKKSKKS